MSALAAPSTTAPSDLLAKLQFDDATVRAAASIIAPNAPPHIIKLVLYRCNQLGVDPMSKMLYAIERGGKWGLQVSIDFLRSVAESSPEYAGQVGPEYCGKDGVWHDVWLESGPPAAARVGIYRRDFVAPLYATARFSSYSAGGPMWQRMPEVMIAKCAESLALRRAFPARLSGLYTADEMQQADRGSEYSAPRSAPTVVKQASSVALVDTLQASVLAKKAERAQALAKDLGIPVARHEANLEQFDGDLDAVIALYEAKKAEVVPVRGPVAAVADPIAEPVVVPEPVPEPVPETPVVPAVAVEKPVRHRRAQTKPEWAAAEFKGTIYADRITPEGKDKSLRLGFAAHVLNHDRVDSFKDLCDKDCEHVVTALHKKLAEIAAIDADLAADAAKQAALAADAAKDASTGEIPNPNGCAACGVLPGVPCFSGCENA